MTTFRLPDPVGPVAVAGAEAFLKPLVPISSAPRSYLVLALSEDAARLIEVTGAGPAEVLPVDEMPRSAADHAGKASINDRSHSGRLVGDEGNSR